MVQDAIDIERCVWDMDYRRKIKRMLNYGERNGRRSANQNVRALSARRLTPAKPVDAPRPT